VTTIFIQNRTGVSYHRSPEAEKQISHFFNSAEEFASSIANLPSAVLIMAFLFFRKLAVEICPVVGTAAKSEEAVILGNISSNCRSEYSRVLLEA